MTSLTVFEEPPLPPPPSLATNCALFLDFDGTLVPIAQRPNDIVVAPYLPDLILRTRSALSGAVGVVTGRTISDIDRFLKWTTPAVAGVHGLHRRTAQGSVEVDLTGDTQCFDQVRSKLPEFLFSRSGVVVEDKGASIALHFRECEEAAEECRKLLSWAAVSSRGQLDLIEGSFVVELKQRGHDKSTAITAFLGQPPFADRVPVFVGDDLSDEAAFLEVHSHGGYSVIVGERRPTCAMYSLNSVYDVHHWIGQIIPNSRPIE